MEGSSKKISFPNGDEYVGETLEMEEIIPHGLGTCYYKDGKKFEGEWFEGIPNGNGVLYIDNGEGYGGKWKNGDLIEIKYKIYANGDQYSGEFKDGFPEGEGLLDRSDGRKFKGKFFRGKFVSGFFTLPDGSKYPIVEKNVTESIDWLEMPEDSEEKQKNWVKDKFLDPEITPSEDNPTHFSNKYTDEEILILAELNPGFGLRRFVKQLYPKTKALRKYEYDFTMLFKDWKDFTGVDLLNHLEDKKYSKLVTGEEYLKITRKKHLPSGYGRSSSRTSSIERKGSPGTGVKVPLKPQRFNWGNVIRESERRYKKN